MSPSNTAKIAVKIETREGKAALDRLTRAQKALTTEIGRSAASKRRASKSDADATRQMQSNTERQKAALSDLTKKVAGVFSIAGMTAYFAKMNQHLDQMSDRFQERQKAAVQVLFDTGDIASQRVAGQLQERMNQLIRQQRTALAEPEIWRTFGAARGVLTGPGEAMRAFDIAERIGTFGRGAGVTGEQRRLVAELSARMTQLVPEIETDEAVMFAMKAYQGLGKAASRMARSMKDVMQQFEVTGGGRDPMARMVMAMAQAGALAKAEQRGEKIGVLIDALTRAAREPERIRVPVAEMRDVEEIDAATGRRVTRRERITAMRDMEVLRGGLFADIREDPVGVLDRIFRGQIPVEQLQEIVPSRKDIAAIQAASRFYRERLAVFQTADPGRFFAGMEAQAAQILGPEYDVLGETARERDIMRETEERAAIGKAMAERVKNDIRAWTADMGPAAQVAGSALGWLAGMQIQLAGAQPGFGEIQDRIPAPFFRTDPAMRAVDPAAMRERGIVVRVQAGPGVVAAAQGDAE
jgi:hypothetical protein